MAQHKVLIVDDEADLRLTIREFLRVKGFAADEAGSLREAEERFRASRPDIAIVDYRLPDGDALQLLPVLADIDPSVPLIVLTAHGTIDLAVQAIKSGAENFLTKPVELPTLLIVLQRSLDNQRTRRKQIAGQAREVRAAPNPFSGTSAAIRVLAEQARRLADTERPLLLLGETGTGKGVLARWFHDHGPRAEEAFVDVNCAGLNREFLESELFGHDKGAFTGAAATKIGLIEVAHRGTLFLDEIGDMDIQVQPKVLKVVEEQRFRRMGSVVDRHADTRLISATHQDLERHIETGAFRGDLYFRISTVPLRLPALRERVEDIPALAQALLADVGAQIGRGYMAIEPDGVTALQAYPWPGNIRELRNVIERAALLCDRGNIARKDLHLRDREPKPLTPEPPAPDAAGQTLDEIERQHIERVLAEERGNVLATARRLGIPRSTLYQRIKKYGLISTPNP